MVGERSKGVRAQEALIRNTRLKEHHDLPRLNDDATLHRGGNEIQPRPHDAASTSTTRRSSVIMAFPERVMKWSFALNLPLPSTRRVRSQQPIIIGNFIVLLLLILLDPVLGQQQEPQPAPATEIPIAAEPTTVPLTPSRIPATTSPLTSNPTLRSSSGPAPIPTGSPRPTASFEPTNFPTTSVAPTNVPTLFGPFEAKSFFQQIFVVRNDTFFSDNQTRAMMELFSGYTDEFAPGRDAGVNTTCDYLAQKFVQDPNATIIQNTVDYSCTYTSRVIDVSTGINGTSYPDMFVEYVNGNITKVTNDLKVRGLNITRAMPVAQFLISTDPPAPAPTILPTISMQPSPIPSPQPSLLPAIPTQVPTRDVVPTPTSSVPTPPPAAAPSNPGSRVSVLVVAIIVVLGGVAVLIGLVFYYRRRVKQRQAMRRPGASGDGVAVTEPGDILTTEGGVTVVSPTGSHVSGKSSLLSEGDSGGLEGDSGDEVDGTKNLLDEFDQYKDQNLEQLRSNVEGNLSGFEGIMSAAVTKALMADEDIPIDVSELLWGCQDPATGPEIEASVLCDVCDWLKRNENASIERKNAFMQDLLNKMVASVRHNNIQAEDASRAIHESAALLSLHLANDLPMTTVIISGMRKTVASNQIVNVLDEFGDIDTAAVASGERGFGIVRFRNPKSVDRALRRYRSAEIVVEDVAVQIKVLMPSGEVVSRA